MPEAPTTLSDLAGQTVLIVGVGREGTALASRLQSLQPAPRLIAVDGREGPATEAFRAASPSIPLHLVAPEGSLPDQCREADVAVMSPGIAMTSALHRAVTALSIPLTSGSALFVADYREQMVGITGSKGKSTTTTLVHALLQGSGVEVALGGNMGIPLQGLPPAEYYSVELSSFQCRYLEESPAVVGLTALFPEHLDWHGDLDTYYGDKLGIVAHQPRLVIANADDATLVHELTTRHPGLPVTWVGQGH